METIDRARFYRITPDLYAGLINLCLTFPLWMRNSKMIEIGSHIGESANIFSLFFNEVHCVDPHENNDTYLTFMRNTHSRNIYLHHRTGDDAVIDFPNEKYSFVYIDAVHDYEHVKQDVKNYYPKIIEGGFIGGHDYDIGAENAGVRKAVNEIFGEPDYAFVDASWLWHKKPNRVINIL